MSGLTTQEIKHGRYTDYGRHFLLQEQYAITTWWGSFITNLIGILVTIAAARIVVVGLRLWRRRSGAVALGSAAPVPPSGPGAGVSHINYHRSGVSGDSLEGVAWERTRAGIRGLYHTAISSGSGFQPFPGVAPLNSPTAVWRYATPTYWKSWPSNHPNAANFTFGVFCLILYLCILAAGVVTSQLASDTTVSSNSEHCGLYLYQTTQQHSAFIYNKPYENKVQVDAGKWADQCYGVPNGADGCGYFLHQSIDYEVKQNITCPFHNDLCHKNEAIGFYTGPTSGRVLGINAPRTYEFQRVSECAVLNMNETYIKPWGNVSDAYKYYYGETLTFGENTMQTIKPSGPTYEVQTFTSGFDMLINHSMPSVVEWTPIPALRPPVGSTTTIVFVIGGRIYYTEASEDPVFPTTETTKFEGDPKLYWVNKRGSAAAFACLERTEWRDPEESKNWTVWISQPTKMPSDRATRAGVWLLKFGLGNSHVYANLNFRLAGALKAQSLISGLSSLPLAKAQWRVEAEQLFRATLARIQIDVRNIARGEAHGHEGFVKAKLPDEICDNSYLFNGVGYTNLLFTASLTTFLLCVIIVICSISWDDDKTWVECLWRALMKTWFGGFVSFLGKVILTAWRKVRNACRSICRNISWDKFNNGALGLLHSLGAACLRFGRFVRSLIKL